MFHIESVNDQLDRRFESEQGKGGIDQEHAGGTGGKGIGQLGQFLELGGSEEYRRRTRDTGVIG